MDGASEGGRFQEHLDPGAGATGYLLGEGPQGSRWCCGSDAVVRGGFVKAVP